MTRVGIISITCSLFGSVITTVGIVHTGIHHTTWPLVVRVHAADSDGTGSHSGTPNPCIGINVRRAGEESTSGTISHRGHHSGGEAGGIWRGVQPGAHGGRRWVLELLLSVPAIVDVANDDGVLGFVQARLLRQRRESTPHGVLEVVWDRPVAGELEDTRGRGLEVT